MDKKNSKYPEWFDINNYEPFKKFSSKRICEEIKYRQLQIKHIIDNGLKSKTNKEGNTPNLLVTHWLNCIRGYGSVLCGTLKDLNISSIKYENSNDEMVLSLDHLEKEYIAHNTIPPKNLKLKDVQEQKPVDLLTNNHIYDYFTISKSLLPIYHENEKSYFQELDKLKINQDPIKFEKYVSEFSQNLLNKINVQSIDNERILFGNDESFNSVQQDSFYINAMFNSDEFSEITPKDSSQLLFVKVDLTSPDASIHHELQRLINLQRDKFSISIPDNLQKINPFNKKEGGMKVIKTLLEQRIIPYIDLFIWNLENNFDVTSDWYMDILYKEEKEKKITIGHSKMNDTIKPNAKKWLDKEWLYSFYYLDIPSYNDIKDNNN